MFSINYLIWKYLLNKTLKKIFRLSFPLEIFFSLCIFLYIPYSICLIVLNYFKLPNDVMSNVKVVFGIVFISFLTYNNLKNEKV